MPAALCPFFCHRYSFSQNNIKIIDACLNRERGHVKVPPASIKKSLNTFAKQIKICQDPLSDSRLAQVLSMAMLLIINKLTYLTPTIMDLMTRIKQVVENADYTCPICGAALYMTDYNENTITFHCSSDKAKFWNFPRGSASLLQAKFHWDRSAFEVLIDDLL